MDQQPTNEELARDYERWLAESERERQNTATGVKFHLIVAALILVVGLWQGRLLIVGPITLVVTALQIALRRSA